MADNELPIPESRQDILLHNIALGEPDITELEPQSRQEVYLKYIALNGQSGSGGSSGAVTSVNGQVGAVTIDANNLNVYEKTETYNKNEVYNKDEIDANVYKKSETYAKDEVYNKTQIDNNIYNKTEIDNKFSELPDVVQERGTSETSIMSQKAVSNNLVFGDGASSNREDCISIGNNSISNEEYSIAIGECASSTGLRSIAIGEGASSTGDKSIALGRASKSTGFSSIAIGQGASTNNYEGAISIGHYSQTIGEYSIAIGYASLSTSANTVSFGGSAESPTKRLVNISDPVNNNDAVTLQYLKSYVEGTTLYESENGSIETITLSESIRNFKKIGVYYYSNSRTFSNSNEFYVSDDDVNGCALQIIYPNANDARFFVRTAYIKFADEHDNKKLEFYRNMSYSVNPDGTGQDTLRVAVYKVVGYFRK